MKANSEKVLEKVKEYQRSNPEKVAASRKSYVSNHRDDVYAKNAARHCRQRRASVAWGNRFFIAEAYRLARLRIRVTGIRYVVDHIIPLSHPLVCGLHVESNLQVIPEALNLRKSNSFNIT